MTEPQEAACYGMNERVSLDFFLFVISSIFDNQISNDRTRVLIVWKITKKTVQSNTNPLPCQLIQLLTDSLTADFRFLKKGILINEEASSRNEVSFQ